MPPLERALLQRPMLDFDVTRQVLRCGIEVHRELGPGLLENAYRAGLVHELKKHGLRFVQEASIPLLYKGAEIDCGYRADLIVEDAVLVELKAVERLLPIHDAQVLTYLKVAKLRIGLILNFNAARLKNGIRRLVR